MIRTNYLIVRTDYLIVAYREVSIKHYITLNSCQCVSDAKTSIFPNTRHFFVDSVGSFYSDKSLKHDFRSI